MRQLDGCPSQALTWTTVQLRMIPMTTWTNWAETTTAHLAGIAQPTTVDELAAAVSAAARDGLRVKPIGAGHSFTSIGQTSGIQIRLDNFAGVVRADVPSGLVTVLAGTRLHELNETLWHLGLSMTNLGDIDAQTISWRDLDRHPRHRRAVRRHRDPGPCAADRHRRRVAAGLQRRAERRAVLCRPGRPRRARRARDGDPAVRARVRPRGVRIAGHARRRPRLPGRQHRRQRPLRVLLVSAHAPRADQAQQPRPAGHPPRTDRPAASQDRRRVPVQHRLRRDQQGHDAPAVA